MKSLLLKTAVLMVVVVTALVGFSGTASAQHCHGYGGGFGGGFGGYYHDTSHFDYHPGYLVPHGYHYDYVPGHYDFHSSGHFHP